jgi:hypothetical protein
MNKEKEKTQKLFYQNKMVITKSCYQCHVQRTLESLLSNEKELKVGPKKILYIKATMFIYLCGQCLEDSFSHCPFLVEFLTVSIFGHLEFACTGGGSPKPRHGIFKDMIFKT